MRNVSAVAAAICLPLLAGCATPYSEAPLATNFPTTKQQKLQAAAHWNVIAGDVARQIAADLKEKPPLHVNPPTAKTEFNRAFGNLLVSALVAEGFSVQKTPVGAKSVDVDTQAVRFSADRPQYEFVGKPTAVMTGLWALRDVKLTTVARVLAAGIGAAAVYDAHAWFRSEFATGETPQTEIIVTTSVSDADRYLTRSTNVYYVADTDSGIYTPPRIVNIKEMRVTGP